MMWAGRNRRRSRKEMRPIAGCDQVLVRAEFTHATNGFKRGWIRKVLRKRCWCKRRPESAVEVGQQRSSSFPDILQVPED